MYQPIIIIGAGRSGTNLLRDLLSSFDDFSTWPCDEINYIWRHGNARFPTDEFTSKMAEPHIQSYIQNQFTSLYKKNKTPFIIEKTCANSLRVGFVNKAVPGSKFIHIVRDGRDVVASAIKRWKAPLDIGYIAKKARYVPKTDIPYYAFNYFLNRIHKVISTDKQLSTWGPRFKHDAPNLSLAATAALQWKTCVDSATSQLKQIPVNQHLTISYEDLIQKPNQVISSIFSFLETPLPETANAITQKTIRTTSIGKWRNDLLPNQHEEAMEIISQTLQEHGYEQ